MTTRNFAPQKLNTTPALLTALLLTGTPLAGRADSLFPVKQANLALRGSSSANPAALFADLRAHGLGDILTITIAETTTAQSSANTKTSADDQVSAFAGTGFVSRFFRDLALTATNSRSGSGTGQTSRSGTLVTTLSVMVKEILPNNTLRIEGTRIVGINKETQKVTFTGIVRPEDIASDNSVPSNLIAGVEVRYDGRGVVGEQQRPGILSRIFRFLF